MNPLLLGEGELFPPLMVRETHDKQGRIKVEFLFVSDAEFLNLTPAKDL